MGSGEPPGGPGRLCELELRGWGLRVWGAGVGVTLPRAYPSPPRCAQSSLDPLLSFLVPETFSAKDGSSKGPSCWMLLLSLFRRVDSLRPHRRQPTRLPRPWDSPGKNTGVGCHCLLQCMKVKSESEVAQSCPTLSDPMDCSPLVSSDPGILQARVLEWGAVPSSRGTGWSPRDVIGTVI